MKKSLFAVLVILTLAAGCLPAATPANELPTAYIDSVSPSQVSPGETVAFTGHGIDPDGSVAAYRWRSSIDGQISTSPTFEASSLSEGTHTVWFSVQDDSGDWSKQIPCHVIVLPSGIVLPVLNLFEADPPSVVEGESSTLYWNVSGASAVRIDPHIGDVALTGNRVVSPTATTTYVLTATNETGSITSTAQVSVATVPTYTVELFSIAAEDGHVRRDGYVSSEPNVGDVTPVRSDVAMQAFLSFDISMIPSGVTVVSASLDLTSYTTFGNPFVHLGTMRVCSDQYGVLDSDDFVVGPATGVLCAVSGTPSKSLASDLLTDAVQEQVDAGRSRFQIRLQFEKDKYFNQEPDYLALGSGQAKLDIEYHD